MTICGRKGLARLRAGGVLLAVLGCSSCVPWTVRPIQDDSDSKPANQTFNAVTYVDSVWASKLIPAVNGSAVDARVLLDALHTSTAEAQKKYGRREGSGACYAVVKGAGRVLSVDTHSRNGVLLVDVAPFDGQADVSIQIGPVLRGSSLRDATGLVRFTDFVNQLQFADVSNELNERVTKTVLAGLDTRGLAGKPVSFVGTCELEDAAKPAIRQLIPVQLEAEQRP